MKAYIVKGGYISAESLIAPEFLPVTFYGYIDWASKVENYKPKKNFKYYRKLAPVLKCVIKLMDELDLEDIVRESEKNRIAIAVSGKLDAERDSLTVKAYEDVDKISPSDGFIITHNLLNFLVASYLGIKYYRGIGIDHVCTSGLDLLGIAKDLVEEGYDTVIVLAINSLATPIRTGYHRNLQVLSKSGKIKPFDVDRDGTIFADAIAMAVIVSDSMINRLKMRPLGRILDYSTISSSYHMFSMDEEGYELEYTLGKVSQSINVKEAIIKAHATGTKLNDHVEGKVYTRLFGDSVPITALKPLFGHTLTASGLIETLYLLEYIKDKGKIPPIRNTTKIDPDCGRIRLVLEEENFDGKYIVSVASAFGGFYSAMAIEVIR